MDDGCAHVVVPARRNRAASVLPVAVRGGVFVFLKGNRQLFAADAQDGGEFVGLGNRVNALQMRPSLGKHEELPRAVGSHGLELDILSIRPLPCLPPNTEDRRMIGLEDRKMQRSGSRCDPVALLDNTAAMTMTMAVIVAVAVMVMIVAATR